MSLLDTIYLGCENNGEIATTDNHVIKFDIGTIRAHPTIMSAIGPVFFRLQTLHQCGVLDKPYKIAVMFPKEYLGFKFKPENKTTPLETIQWFLNNYHPPACGVIVSIYSFDDIFGSQIQEPWSQQIIWPLAKEWQNDGEGDYITLHDIEPLIAGGPKHQNTISSGHSQVIDKIDEISIYPVKRVSYADGEQKIFETMKHSKMHFSYNGGTYFSAGLIGLPMVCFGEPRHNISRGKYWENGEEEFDNIQSTDWMNGCNNPVTKIGQYNFETNSVVQHPQRYARHANSAEELEGYIRGWTSFSINKIEYSL